MIAVQSMALNDIKQVGKLAVWWLGSSLGHLPWFSILRAHTVVDGLLNAHDLESTLLKFNRYINVSTIMTLGGVLFHIDSQQESALKVEAPVLLVASLIASLAVTNISNLASKKLISE